MKSGIVEKPISSRTAVHACQAELLVRLARELIEAHAQRPGISLQEWFALPEYDRFVLGAYATGFVCADLAPMKDFEEINAHPREKLGSASLRKLRHWVHTLLRAERWADGYSSPICEAVVSGAIAIAVDRLGSDAADPAPREDCRR